MLITPQLRVKPAVSAMVNRSHSLARGLAGCWVLNEGAGRTVYDASGYHRDGSLSGEPVWSAGSLGRTVEFDGNDDWISMGDCLDLGTGDTTVLALLQYSAANQPNEWMGTHIGAIAGKGYLDGSGKGYGLLVGTNNEVFWQIRNQATELSVPSNSPLNDNRWHIMIGVCDRDDSMGVRLYIDGVCQSITADATTLNGIELSGSRAFAIGSRQEEVSGTWYWDFLGSIAMVCVWKRVIEEAEIRRLQQDPFGMFAARRALHMLTPSSGTTIQCEGSTHALASTSGAARVARTIVGVIVASTSATAVFSTWVPVQLSAAAHGCTALHGVLSRLGYPPVADATRQAEPPWQREALFNGMTHAAWQLATTLTQGWFWIRRNGCTVVYRGTDIGHIDRGRILYVAEPNVKEIPLPAYLSHAAGSTYCYLVRRFNGCGQQEKTVVAATGLSIAPDGGLAQARPNTIVALSAGQTDATHVRLVWLYCPLDQRTAPGQFNVYGSDADGPVNFEVPIGTIPYKGRPFYCFDADGLTPGRYAFVVRAASTDGVEDTSSTGVLCQISAAAPEPAEILVAECV